MRGKNVGNFLKWQKELSILISLDKGDSVIRRFCVVPKNWDTETIFCYLEHSLNVSRQLINFEIAQEVVVFDESIKNYNVIDTRMIEYYWHDVKEFIIEITSQVQQFSFVFVTGYGVHEDDVRNIITNIFPNNQIKIDYYRDCWLPKYASI